MQKSDPILDLDGGSDEDLEAAEIYATIIGNLVRSLRTEARLGIKTLAHRAAITPETLAQIEKGESLPDRSSFRRLAEALRLDPAELMERAEEAVKGTEAAAQEALGKRSLGPGWRLALKVAGAVGVAGLVAFVVAGAIDRKS